MKKDKQDGMFIVYIEFQIECSMSCGRLKIPDDIC